MLDTLDRFDMDARTARPVWLTVSVPDDAPAGVYRSCVEVTGCGVKSLPNFLSNSACRSGVCPALRVELPPSRRG